MENINLARKLEERLPSDALDFIKRAAKLAGERGKKLYLAGGLVRDLLMDKPGLDIDLVLEGDATLLASEMAQGKDVKVTLHKPFLTANLRWREFSIDLTTARRESYAHPGALPAVQPGSLKDDLLRRDFSVNAMAVSLSPADYGQLIDLYGGLADINHRLIRILHEKSFIDDATRIWRAIRYEQRLDFNIEAGTLALLHRGLPMLKTISGDRIWYEMECVFGEELPEKFFARAGELGVLTYLHPELRVDGWLTAWFDQARRLSLPGKPPLGLYLALLAYNLNSTTLKQLINYLKLSKVLSQTLRDSRGVKAHLEALSEEVLQPSAIHCMLQGHSEQAITANLIASNSVETRRNIQLYLDKLRYVKTALDGNDLIALGIPQGPLIKAALDMLLDARLDGEVESREDEERWVRQFKLSS